MINQLELQTPDDDSGNQPPSHKLTFSLLKLILLAIESIVRVAFPPLQDGKPFRQLSSHPHLLVSTHWT